MDGTASHYIEMGIEHLSAIPGYDPSFEVIYYNYWSDYEENGWMAILYRNGDYFLINGGYSVMSNDNDDRWFLCPQAEHEALQEIEEYEEMLAEHE